jgi:glycosyltransferase involved in cell wall biosynthesis
MKIFVDYEMNESGKGKFLSRLIPALGAIGIELSFSQKGCDLALGISRWRTKPRMRRVLRVDGIYMDGEDKRDRWVNDQVCKAIKKSDAVIFQSRYARETVIKNLRPKIKKDYVIYNGADPGDYSEAIETGYTLNVIASAKWCNRHGLRKSKGLKQTLAKLLEFSGPSVGLFVAGDVPIRYRCEGIHFLGRLPEIELRKWLAASDKMVYMAKRDWCPNAVVEAIVAGCEIICSPECRAVQELVAVGPEKLHISTIAQQYKKVFLEVA